MRVVISVHPIKTRNDLLIWKIEVTAIHTLYSIIVGQFGVLIGEVAFQSLAIGIAVGVVSFSLAFCKLVIDWVWREEGILPNCNNINNARRLFV